MPTTFEQPSFLFTVLMFILMIGPLVFVHEMGHYLVGRLFRTKVDSFSIGFGPQIAGWRDRRGTVWRLSALPLGGYVKFAGDANAAGAGSEGLSDIPLAERGDYFAFKPLWQRALIVLAGPAINFLFAILIFAGFAFTMGQITMPPIVGQVQEGSAADAAGFEVGDRITSIDGREINEWPILVQEVRMNPGVPMTVSLVRDGMPREVTLTPKIIEMEDRFGNRGRIGQLGVANADAPEVRQVGLIESVGIGISETARTVRSMVDLLSQLIRGQRSIEELGGPLKIGQMSGQVGTLGAAAFVSFMALISINLGFINLLPIPMLDGGHLALYAAEAARGGKPLPERAQQWAFMGGFALVISFMLVVTFNDLASFGVWRHALELLG
ncbi:RIP metalloprotease RseP [Pacificimonas sp. WHA3]|uniref:Zinc metalloprotease n=1 Tax=Pacificimonas pallii TaxID=2827236 RepID=A0ABS6SDX9_9SPHN|nr:RIP metalloprotease RseP [Pacificimonas pallii]MBV7256579.1 RIP metalloprotease RseP [Pacificimonas pallii]